MTIASRLYGWNPENGPWDTDLSQGDIWGMLYMPGPIFSPVFKNIGFGTEPIPTWYTDLRDIYLWNDDALLWTRRRTPAMDHPIAMRSFACFPTLALMVLDLVDDDVTMPSNIQGVTVWDIVRCIHSA